MCVNLYIQMFLTAVPFSSIATIRWHSMAFDKTVIKSFAAAVIVFLLVSKELTSSNLFCDCRLLFFGAYRTTTVSPLYFSSFWRFCRIRIAIPDIVAVNVAHIKSVQIAYRTEKEERVGIPSHHLNAAVLSIS